MITRLSRRHILMGSGAALLASACRTQPAASRKIQKIGLQTYTLREAMQEDFVGTFQMIKAAGYDYVELNGRNFTDKTPAELRGILDDVGLPAPATHVDYDSLANRTEALAETANVLGCKYVILPWIGDDQRAFDDYKRHADMMNGAAEVLKSYNVKLAYHNHQFEFFDLGDDETGMDILLSETEAGLVNFELDLFWASLAGVDIPSLLNAHSGRFKLFHVKDMKGDATPWRSSLDFGKIVQALMVNVGEGDLPFAQIFAEGGLTGSEYFIAEHDNPPHPYAQSILKSYSHLNEMRF